MQRVRHIIQDSAGLFVAGAEQLFDCFGHVLVLEAICIK